MPKEPNHRALHWRQRLPNTVTSPVHFDFSAADARSFIRTVIVVDTQTGLASTDTDTRKFAEQAIEYECFPQKLLEYISRLDRTLQLAIRHDIDHVLILRDTKGRLGDLLPIEILMHTLERAANLQLFTKYDLRSEENRSETESVLGSYLPWLLSQEATDACSVFRLLFELSVVRECPKLRRQFDEIIKSSRREHINWWNEQQAANSRREAQRIKLSLS